MTNRFFATIKTQLGLARSFLTYYGIPGRFKRMRRFYSQFVQPGDLCFDIGAHLGNRIRVWLALGADVVAVEPQPQMTRWLKLLYGRNPRVHLVSAAIGAEPGQADMYISSLTPTVTTLSAAWMNQVRKEESFSSVRWDKSIQVPVITLQALIEAHHLPDFCKIDVEGYEHNVLRGVGVALPALSFEHVRASGDITIACLELLKDFGEYTYNYSRGESHQLHFPSWLTDGQLLIELPDLPGSSGDIYARLTDSDGK